MISHLNVAGYGFILVHRHVAGVEKFFIFEQTIVDTNPAFSNSEQMVTYFKDTELPKHDIESLGNVLNFETS